MFFIKKCARWFEISDFKILSNPISCGRSLMAEGLKLYIIVIPIQNAAKINRIEDSIDFEKNKNIRVLARIFKIERWVTMRLKPVERI